MEQKEMYKIKEVAKILDISERTVYRLMELKKIKAVRVGGQWRIPRVEIEKYTKAMEVKNG
jgi:excisionase family DNA binding protein